MTQKLVFEKGRGPNGFSYRGVHLEDDGSLVVVGHDLGEGVEAWFGPGNTEYEFERRLDPEAVDRLRDTLEIEPADDLLAVLAERFAGTHEIEKAIADAGIEATFWNRIGS